MSEPSDRVVSKSASFGGMALDVTKGRELATSTEVEVSIVVPAYREAQNLERLYEEIVAALEDQDVRWEVIIVDDGSPDDTWKAVTDLCRRDPRIRGLRFSRNFGHQYALYAGLTRAAGQAVITMDGDLQHPPSVIPTLLEHWRGGSQIVQTVRRDSKDLSWWKRVTSRLYYRLFSFLSGVRLAPGMADFRLLDRQVVTELLAFRESGLFLRGLVEWVGYRSSVVEFDCGKRHAGSTSYTLARMVALAWAGVSSFSVVPLRLAVFVGLLTSLFAFVQLGGALYARIVSKTAVPGWASAIGVTSLLFGILFIFLGIIGEYLARVLVEVRGRPRFLVADSEGFEGSQRVLEPEQAPEAE